MPSKTCLRSLLPAIAAAGALTSSSQGQIAASGGDAAGVHMGEPAADRAWWRDAVFYQVFVRSFADASEGPFAGDGKGDFRGLIERLDYLNDGDPDTTDDLGVTALWLMPVFESETYHGYDVEDYTSIDAELGNNELFKEFVDACHERGIRVIVDYVINHSSWNHPWFREAIQPNTLNRSWYRFEDVRPMWRGPWGQNVWHDNARGQSGKSYYGVFSPTMPDLNLRNGQVTRQLHNAAELWLTAYGIDGFRLDAIKYLIENSPEELENTSETLNWLAHFRDHVHETKPGGFVVGEVWDSTETVKLYIDEEAVDSGFEFDLSFKLFDSINEGDATQVSDQIAKLAERYAQQGHVYSTFLSNHDQTRTRTRFAGDWAKSRLAATIQLTLPGTPFIYYGEELGMTGDKPDPDIRTPMPWSDTLPHGGFTTADKPWRPLNDDTAEVSVPVAQDEGGLGSHYRSLIALRHRHAWLRSDHIEVIDTGDPRVLAYARGPEGSGERVTVVANVSGEAVPMPSLKLAEGTRIVIGDGGAGDRETGGLGPHEALMFVGPPKQQ